MLILKYCFFIAVCILFLYACTGATGETKVKVKTEQEDVQLEHKFDKRSPEQIEAGKPDPDK